ncbi:MAG: Crp/Fnr family transcriptional regulator [Clostridiales bacterium]|nr:Crp/Fnr family transcriptional regulator [Clostridiales bacterium]
MNSISNITINHPILSYIPSKHLKNLEEKGHIWIKSYSKGTIIYFESDLCISNDILIKGALSVQSYQKNGNILTVSKFNAGDTFGSNLLFGHTNHYPMSIVADNDVIILSLHKDCILELCQQSKVFLEYFIKSLSENATTLGKKIHSVGINSLRENIVLYLSQLAVQQKNLNITIPISRQTWAEILGVHRPSLSRELAKMKKEEILIYNKNKMTLLDKDLFILK